MSDRKRGGAAQGRDQRTNGRRASTPAVAPGREQELREMLLDVHEHLLRRDDEILRRLGLVLEGSVDAAEVLRNGNGNGRSKGKLVYRQLLHDIREAAQTVLLPESTVLVVSKGDEDLLELGVGRTWHFPRARDGAYAGFHPRDSEAAIAHLEELRRQGAEYLLRPWSSNWWLEHYADFGRYLRSTFPCVLENERLVVFQLAG